MCPKESNNERHILEAAEAEFLEKGYGKARTTEIARRAGVTHAMLHYYYRTKENLFDMVFRNKVQTMAEILLFSFGTDLPFLDKVKKGMENHFDFIVANDKLPNFIFSEIFADEKLRAILVTNIKEKAEQVVGNLAAEMDEEVRKGTIRYMAPLDLIVSMISLNVFSVVCAPALTDVLGMDRNEFLQRRKHVNIELILNRLEI
ncbi:MAG: TetR/AcrR family transcriptional regulator [Rikenellaceae bacterium]|nr:TetR/AcrR family transcriptional regulator [Rikenellaceae bacterium]